MGQIKIKKRKPPPEEGAPLWMATYADLMSLLLCFFVLLFSMSVITEIKWEAFIITMEHKMGYTGKAKKVSRGKKTASAMSTTSEMGRRTAALTGGQPIAGKSESAALQTIAIAGDVVKGGLIFFERGSDQLGKQAEENLAKLYPVLLASPSQIMVHGYVAPTEEEAGIYSRDIYLARARAVNVMDYLISLGLRKEFFQISASDSTTIPNRAVLPREMREDPKLAGASAAVYLIKGVLRPSTKTLPEPQATDAPVPEEPQTSDSSS